MNGERKAKYKRLLNMKISGEAIERLEEEGFRGPVRGWPVHSQVGRSPSTEPWQRGLSAKEILLCSGLSAERAGRGGGNMPAAETSTKVNNPTSNGAPVICTPFTGHPVEGVLLCGTHMSTKGNV